MGMEFEFPCGCVVEGTEEADDWNNLTMTKCCEAHGLQTLARRRKRLAEVDTAIGAIHSLLKAMEVGMSFGSLACGTGRPVIVGQAIAAGRMALCALGEELDDDVSSQELCEDAKDGQVAVQ